MERMYFMQSRFFLFVLLIGVFIACNDTTDNDQDVKPDDSYQPTPYKLQVPKGFPLYNISKENPLTVEGVELGKRLYREPMLSSNGLTCSSCHHQDKSFSTPIYNAANGYKISVPPHINLAFKRHFNWNGSEKILDTLCMVDFGPEFFNTDSAQLYNNLYNSSYYKDQFYKAFLIKDIRQLNFEDLKRKITYAISQYMRTIISSKSKYDKMLVGEYTFTDKEMQGMLLFFSETGDCFHCHQPPLFSDTEFHNTGLSSVFNGFDRGRELITNNPIDIGKFATPTLRNLEYTAPYMHDGRFNTLEEVVEFYNSGVHVSPNIDPIMSKKAPSYKLNLTQEQKDALVAFLKTLTDESIINLP